MITIKTRISFFVAAVVSFFICGGLWFGIDGYGLPEWLFAIKSLAGIAFYLLMLLFLMATFARE